MLWKLTLPFPPTISSSFNVMNHLEKNVFSTIFPKDFIRTLPKFEYYREQDSQQLLLNLHLVMTVLES